jgi:hypothetical protein
VGIANIGLAHDLNPAHENFKNTKFSKTSLASLGPRENLLGRAGCYPYIEIFFSKSEISFKQDFSVVKVGDFSGVDRKAKSVKNFGARKACFK